MENTLCGEYTVWRIHCVENTLCGEYTVRYPSKVLLSSTTEESVLNGQTGVSCSPRVLYESLQYLLLLMEPIIEGVGHFFLKMRTIK